MIDGFKGFVLIILLWFAGVLVKLEMDIENVKKEMRKKGWDI